MVSSSGSVEFEVKADLIGKTGVISNLHKATCGLDGEDPSPCAEIYYAPDMK